MAGIKVLALPESVKEVLRNSEITDTHLTLPGTLDRKLYVAVDKILNALGLFWDKKAKCHMSPGVNPKMVLDVALNGDGVVNKKQTFQEFFTPPEVAAQMVDIATSSSTQPNVCTFKVLEPSAGDGALIRAVKAQSVYKDVRVLAVETQERHMASLQKLVGPHAIQADFLKLDPMLFGRFDLVIMNPPFNGNQDIDHVEHAFKFLRPEAILASIMSVAAWEGNQKKQKLFQEVMAPFVIRQVGLPPGTFKDSGTGVRAFQVFLRRPPL